jgi:hypothetical protein
MLRLVLLAGGVRITLQMGQARLAFWGAALGDAADVRLQVQDATVRVQQLVAAAPGNTLPCVVQLSVWVSLHSAWQVFCRVVGEGFEGFEGFEGGV